MVAAMEVCGGGGGGGMVPNLLPLGNIAITFSPSHITLLHGSCVAFDRLALIDHLLVQGAK